MMDAEQILGLIVGIPFLIFLFTGIAAQLFGIYEKNKYIETGEHIEPPKILVWLATGINFCLNDGLKILIGLLIIVFALGMITGGSGGGDYDPNDTYSKWEYINKFDTPLAPLDK